MNQPAIELVNVSYSYERNQDTIKNISLNVPPGSIYGFLGPNGAGKSTTIRLISGLLKAKNGSIRVYGKSLADNVENLSNISSLIEMPSLYEHLTGYENLAIACLLKNIPKIEIEKALALVKMQKHAKTLVRKYSLGMKQRLGIAMALVSDPDLLILDEPTNGLDPHGIIEIRELLLELNQNQQKTILVSSHNLAEIEKIATHVGIIHQGKMVFEGTVEMLEKLKNSENKVYIQTADAVKCVGILGASNDLAALDAETLIYSCSGKENIALLIKKMVENGLPVYGVNNHRSSLEELFIDLIGA